MVSRSRFAHGVCLGRSANNGFYWVGNWGKQHQRRSEHNNEQHFHTRFSEQHRCGNTGWCGCGSYGCSRRSDERDYCRSVNYIYSEHWHDRNKLDRRRINLHQSEHDRHWNNRDGRNIELRNYRQ